MDTALVSYTPGVYACVMTTQWPNALNHATFKGLMSIVESLLLAYLLLYALVPTNIPTSTYTLALQHAHFCMQYNLRVLIGY